MATIKQVHVRREMDEDRTPSKFSEWQSGHHFPSSAISQVLPISNFTVLTPAMAEVANSVKCYINMSRSREHVTSSRDEVCVQPTRLNFH